MDVEKWIGLMINFFNMKLLMGFWRVKKKDDEGFRCDFEIKFTIFGSENWNLRRNTETYGNMYTVSYRRYVKQRKETLRYENIRYDTKTYVEIRKDMERYRKIKRETNWNLFLISSKIVLKQNNSESRSIIFTFYKKMPTFSIAMGPWWRWWRCLILLRRCMIWWWWVRTSHA